jgi:hypothetical protein
MLQLDVAANLRSSHFFGAFDRAYKPYSNGWIRLQRISVFLPPASWEVSNGGFL